MPMSKSQKDKHEANKASNNNKQSSNSNADKKEASDRARASSAKKEPTPAPKPTPVAAPKASYAVVSSRPSTPAPKPQVVSKPSTPAPKPTPAPAPKPSYAVVASRPSTPTTRTATPAPKPTVASSPKPGALVSPGSATALKQAATKTVSTPAGPKQAARFPETIAKTTPTYRPGDQGRIKAGTPVTASMIKSGMTTAPLGAPLSASDALRANQMAVKYNANPAKTVSTPAGPKVVDPMKSSFAKGPTTSGRGTATGGAPVTAEDVLSGIGRPLFGPESKAGYTGRMFPSGGPLRIRVSPEEATPPMDVSLISPAEFAAMFPKKPTPPVAPAAYAGAPAGGGGGSSSGGGGLPSLATTAGGRMANLISNAPTVGGMGTDARLATSMAPALTGTQAGGGGSQAPSMSGSVGTGGGSAAGAGSGGGQGSGGGLGGGIGGIGAGAGEGQGTGDGSGAGAGLGTGAGTGSGAGAGAGVGAGTGGGGGAAGGAEAGVAPPTGPSGCPPGYYLYTRPDGTTICVPETSGLPMVRPVVAPYYQPMGVGSLEGYVPYPGQT